MNVIVGGYRSVDHLAFEASPFTVLFGKNNTGKTNILEAVYDVVHSQNFKAYTDVVLHGDPSPTRRRDFYEELGSYGALFVELDAGVSFDATVVGAIPKTNTNVAAVRVAFTDGGLFAIDPTDSYARLHASLQAGDNVGALTAEPAITFFEGLEPIDAPTLTALLLDWQFNELNKDISTALSRLVSVTGDYGSAWLEPFDLPGIGTFYRHRQDMMDRLYQFATLTTDLLPDFLDGAVEASVNPPTIWERSPKVVLEYAERGRGELTHPLFGSAVEVGHVEGLGHGAARWIAAAAKVALRLITDHRDVASLRDLELRGTGYVLLVDEPEAHLHPSAVASIVRWCHRMVSHGFTVVVASHHDEFLRIPGDEATLVHVTRDANRVHTNARTLPVSTTTRLQELADDIGMHPASALSLHRAILFVEGPLDEAVLDEYAGLELDAAGVKIIPIHGTRNYEGIISAELISGLGIKTGVLFDNTIPETMGARPKKKRSGEENKLVKLLSLFDQQDLPAPAIFGVPEDDLLWALPADAIREHVNDSFPGWKTMLDESREASGMGPSDSVDWKTYGLENYDLPINSPTGVRSLVRLLDLQTVEMPSIRAVVDQIVHWSK